MTRPLFLGVAPEFAS